jgi:hypothetical protein
MDSACIFVLVQQVMDRSWTAQEHERIPHNNVETAARFAHRYETAGLVHAVDVVEKEL